MSLNSLGTGFVANLRDNDLYANDENDSNIYGGCKYCSYNLE